MTDADRYEAGQDGRHDGNQQGAADRRLGRLIDVTEEARQQAVAGHDEEDTALAEAHDQKDRREAADSADGDGSGTPMIADELQCIGNRSGRRLEL